MRADIDLRPPEHAAFNWIHVTEDALVNFENVVEGDEVGSKNLLKLIKNYPKKKESQKIKLWIQLTAPKSH